MLSMEEQLSRVRDTLRKEKEAYITTKKKLVELKALLLGKEVGRLCKAKNY